MSGKQENFALDTEGKESLRDRLSILIGNRSVRAAAKDWGLSVSTLNNYITKGTEPGFNVMTIIANKEHVSLDWIANGKELEKPQPQPQPQQLDDDATIQGINAVLRALDENERNQLYRLIARKGADFLVNLLNSDNQQLMGLTGEARELALLLSKMRPENVSALWKQAQCSEDLPANIITNKRASA